MCYVSNQRAESRDSVFIELVEYLRCPSPHDDTYLVLVPRETFGRDVRRGAVGCPRCKAEYPIVDGVVAFGESSWPDVTTDSAPPLPDPQVVQALLGLESPGGFVVLIGSASRLAPQLAELIGGVHFVSINAPPDVESSPVASPLNSRMGIPLKSSVMRGVVVGEEHVAPPWVEEGVRVLLNRQRLVLLQETDDVADVEPLAVGQGLWVGEKRQPTR